MAAKIGGWLLYFAIVAGLIFVGWRQPLNYRFKSAAQIYAIEHPATPPPVVVVKKPATWTPARTSLDGDGSDGRGSSYRTPATPPPGAAR